MNTPSPLESIFFAALAKSSPGERAAYLDEACAGDANLRRRVEKMLTAQSEVRSFLEQPAAAIDTTVSLPRAKGLGTLIGPYKLVELIGEGGMGAVYLAQQTEPVKRLVALKVIKAGMDSRQVLARFEAERQALALMDHPNIAKVHDAGTTPDGRPYFVMELVKGVPITKFCDERKLTPRERLELFLPVCHAIQHAHQKGIIHRDIKPTNVLLALYDSKPVPKVIDFGVAKAAGQPLTEKTLVTGLGALVGTPEYMSPEQAELNQLDIDTRSDVYSLGVLLYELLTGTTPLDRNRVKEKGLLEVLRIVREEEAPTLGNRLSRTDELPTIAYKRGLPPAKLTQLVRGELDWIVMKALEKDRSRRYESANGLAMDVQRYLTGETVRAVPPSVGYQLRKFTRRNKVAFAMASLVLSFLVVLGSGIGWAIRDRDARVAALINERGARRAKLNQEVEAALREADALRERALTFTDNPYQWQATLAASFSALKRAQGLAVQDDAVLESVVRERLQTVQSMLEADETDRRFVARFDETRMEQTQIRPEVSEFKLELAYSELKKSFRTYYRIDVGTTSVGQVVALVRQRPNVIQEQLLAALDYSLAHAPREEVQARQWLIAVLEVADPDSWRKQARQALAAQQWPTLEKLLQDLAAGRQPLTLRSRLTIALPPETPTRLPLLRQIQHSRPGDFWANHDLAAVLHYRQRPQLDEAIRYYTAALALRPRNPGASVNLGNALREKGDLDAAIAAYRDAVEQQPDYPAGYERLGSAFAELGQWDKAAAEFENAARLAARDVQVHYRLALVRLHLGDLDGYRKVCSGMLERFGETADANAARWTSWTCGLAPDAVDDWGRVIALAETNLASDPKDCDKLQNLGVALYRAGRFADAAKRLTEADTAFPRAKRPLSSIIYTWLFQAMAQHRLGHAEEARRWFKKAVEDIDQPLPVRPQDGHADTWYRRLTLQLLRRETEEVLRKG